jgi:type II secretory pathway component PulF
MQSKEDGSAPKAGFFGGFGSRRARAPAPVDVGFEGTPTDKLVFDNTVDEAYYSSLNRFANWWARTFDFGSWKRRSGFYNGVSRLLAKEQGLMTILAEWKVRYDARGDMRAAALGRMIDRIDAGAHVEVAMAEYLPPMERVMIMVGRETGRLDKGFAQARFVAQSMGRLKSIVRAGLAYPAGLSIFIAIMLTLISFMLVPVLEALLPVPKWPLISKVLYYLSYAVRHYALWMVASVIVASLALRWMLPNWTGAGRGFADRWLPIFTLYRENASATFLIAIASLIESGQSLGGAIRKVGELATPWLKSHTERMLELLAEGSSADKTLDTGLLANEVVDNIAVYAKTSQLDEGLVELGRTTIEDAIERIERIIAVIRVIGLLVVGGTLLLMMVGTLWVARAMIREYRLPIPI